MRVMFVGLGKLGLPVALAIRAAGHDVVGVEIDFPRAEGILNGEVPDKMHEPYVAEYLRKCSFPVFATVDRAVRAWSPDVIMLAVQTPHQPRFEGVTPLTEAPEDFDYTHLKRALAETVGAVAGSDPLVVTISTCLPGTYERHLKSIVSGVRYAYNPFFIAMGSVIHDFRHPEFILVGTENEWCPPELIDLYSSVIGLDITPEERHLWDGDSLFQAMSIASAELTKVAYNAFIGQKLMLANGVAMLCEATGAHADDVMDALCCATDRLVSTKYLRAGMGDGGACHPRDQIALSWLAQSLGIHDPYDSIIRHREAHAKWLAHIWVWARRNHMTRSSSPNSIGLEGLPMVMLGSAYKPNSYLDTGSPALLVAHYASELWGPVRIEDRPFKMEKACYFLGCPHDHFLQCTLPEGSVLIDPWGLYEEREGIEVIRPGRRRADAARRVADLPGMQAGVHAGDGEGHDTGLQMRDQRLEGVRTGAGEREGAK